jgi:uncharacterized membrane protein YcaP (DUF421 family)
LFFSNWASLGRIAVVGIGAYAALVVLLRISGKRTLSKMNAFDFVVTVALGSTLATVLLSKDVALIEGIVAFALLIALQYGVAWLSVRSASVQQLVKSEPTLLFYEGEYLTGAMKSERVAKEEIQAAIRSQGIMSIESIAAVVLETDGSFSVLSQTGGGPPTALTAVERFPPSDSD